MHDKNYSYPLDPGWSTAEIETVIAMFRVVEDAYETGINQQIMDCYRDFKNVVPAKSEEKRLGKEFAKVTGAISSMMSSKPLVSKKQDKSS